MTLQRQFSRCTMTVGTVWKCTFDPQKTNTMHLKMLYIFNMIHQYFIYQSLAQYSLASGQNIYKYFWNCAITFWIFVQSSYRLTIYVCLYTKKLCLNRYNTAYSHNTEKKSLVLLVDINTLTQIFFKYCVSTYCESEYFKLLHLGYN